MNYPLLKTTIKGTQGVESHRMHNRGSYPPVVPCIHSREPQLTTLIPYGQHLCHLESISLITLLLHHSYITLTSLLHHSYITSCVVLQLASKQHIVLKTYLHNLRHTVNTTCTLSNLNPTLARSKLTRSLSATHKTGPCDGHLRKRIILVLLASLYFLQS